MEMKTVRRRASMAMLMASIMLASSLLAGCTALDPVRPRAMLSVYPDQITAGDAINLDARESTPGDGVIISYVWDFGDGSETKETLVGFNSHIYQDPGSFTVSVTVVNSEGGEDSATADLFVNGLPVIVLELPEHVKAGESVRLDASESYDPEGGALSFEWDLNHSSDSDADGNPADDIDSTEEVVTIPTHRSGMLSGSLRITDDIGAVAIKAWEISVSTRTYEVRWNKRTVEYTWSGNLKSGEEWNSSHVPALSAMVYAVNATLTLVNDGNPLGDENFTLSLTLADNSWSADAESFRPQSLEEARANIARSEMNPIPEGTSVLDADSRALVLAALLSDYAVFGAGEWHWVVFSEGFDTGLPFDPDQLDPGNEWSLELSFVVYEPAIVELGVIV